MGFQHSVLFEIMLGHRYFSDALDGNIALSIEPTPDTWELIRDYKLLFRSRPGKGSVYFKGNPLPGDLVDPFLDFNDDYENFDEEHPTIFRFYIFCNDPNYLNYTELGVTNLNRKIIYLRGLRKPTAPFLSIPYPLVEVLSENSTVETLSIQSSTFYYELQPDPGDIPNPITLEITDHLDITLQSIEVEYDAGSNVYRTQVDLSEYGRGKYVLKYNTTEEGIYVDGFLFGRKPFAVLEIYKENWWENIPTTASYRTNPLYYRVFFTARKSTWLYYIVLKSGNHSPLATYEILDDETSDPDDNRYLNGGMHLPPFVCNDVTPGGGTQIDGYDARIFECTTGVPGLQEIAYLTEAKPDLTLYKDSAPILTNLPNPGINSINAEIIIYV